MTILEKHIDNVLAVINSRFYSKFSELDLFFLIKSKKDKRVFSFMRGLLGMFLLSKNNGETILCESTWARLNTYSAPVAGATPNAHLPWIRLPFHDVVYVAVYEYGFEIRTDSQTELVAIRRSDYAAELTPIGSALLNNCWKMPELRSGVNQETLMIWSRPSDDFDDFLRRKLKHHKMDELDSGPCIGQVKRKLHVDSEI